MQKSNQLVCVGLSSVMDVARDGSSYMTAVREHDPPERATTEPELDPHEAMSNGCTEVRGTKTQFHEP
ncbi:hypothetical protein PR202_gb03019 [Eleusine coracana subsp. coracana]|uniref:Uncharacterized protein n=1 Tax=Eleusine coracana subsp. coracana TaxID=191504 RepID=A0AAV5E0Y5_ELECO|nr:hypothetical protein PR202_gb03019 [Eleusine coracana subsp. coracana]